MEKKYYVLKLVASRPTFMMDMTAEEGEIMNHHKNYWAELLHDGRAIIYGPVLDQKAPYGLAIVVVENEEEAKDIAAKDPAMAILHYEISPMMAITADQV